MLSYGSASVAERILLTFTRPKSALALLDEIAALRAARDDARQRAAWYLEILYRCGMTPGTLPRLPAARFAGGRPELVDGEALREDAGTPEHHHDDGDGHEHQERVERP